MGVLTGADDSDSSVTKAHPPWVAAHRAGSLEHRTACRLESVHPGDPGLPGLQSLQLSPGSSAGRGRVDPPRSRDFLGLLSYLPSCLRSFLQDGRSYLRRNGYTQEANLGYSVRPCLRKRKHKGKVSPVGPSRPPLWFEVESLVAAVATAGWPEFWILPPCRGHALG